MYFRWIFTRHWRNKSKFDERIRRWRLWYLICEQNSGFSKIILRQLLFVVTQIQIQIHIHIFKLVSNGIIHRLCVVCIHAWTRCALTGWLTASWTVPIYHSTICSMRFIGLAEHNRSHVESKNNTNDLCRWITFIRRQGHAYALRIQ